MKERKSVRRRILRITTVVLVTLLILAAGMLAVTKIIHDYIYPRFERSILEDALNIKIEAQSSEYPTEEITFPSGDNTLKGYISGSDDADALVVIVPGLSAGAEDYTSLAMEFMDLGYKVFSFDSTGSFESEGANSVGFSQIVKDLEAALDYISTAPDLKDLELNLFGHSRGGYGAAMVAKGGYNINAIATVGAVNSPMEITMEWSEDYVGLFAYTGYPALYLYQNMLFGSEIMSTSAADAIDESGVRSLIIHCENDATVDIDGSAIFAHKDEVESKNAEFMLYENPSNAGHTTLLYTESANTYRQSVTDEYEKLSKKYGGNIPEDVNEEFIGSIDSFKAKEPNRELVKLISDFYKNKN